MRKGAILGLSMFLLVGCEKEVLYQSTMETPPTADALTTGSTDPERMIEEAEELETIQETDWELEQTWNGTWSWSGHMNGAVLLIENEQNSRFDFSLMASSGANTGELSGQATLLGDGITAKSVNKDEPGCVVTLIKSEQEIAVEVTDACAGFAGNGVTLSGIFGYGEMEEEEITLVSLGLVAEDVDETIHSILGEDYELLIERMHLVSESEDLDELDATVLHGGVRGLFSIMEGLVMYNSQGKVWVALLVGDTIEYYTNDTHFKQTLPLTIRKWSERFNGVNININ